MDIFCATFVLVRPSAHACDPTTSPACCLIEYCLPCYRGITIKYEVENYCAIHIHIACLQAPAFMATSPSRLPYALLQGKRINTEGKRIKTKGKRETAINHLL